MYICVGTDNSGSIVEKIEETIPGKYMELASMDFVNEY